MAEQNSNIKNIINVAASGMNMDSAINQIPKGALSYALNGVIESTSETLVSYQNEQGNIECLKFPEGFQLIGKHFIVEQSKHIFFLTDPNSGESEIGYMENNDCIYRPYINASCLNFHINHPIHKVVHKITNCSTEIYWTDGRNPRRFLDLNEIPYITEDITNCNTTTIQEIDCNKLNIQPNFSIPVLKVVDVVSGGNLQAGTVQFAFQYADVAGDAYTSYYSITNPTPIVNTFLTTENFDYNVGKSVILNISNIDVTGYFEYFNLAVIKTVNNITSVELVGTYTIDNSEKQITYNGQNSTQIRLTIDDIFEKFPYYEIAQDLTMVNDVLVWDQLTSIDRINYQGIANKIGIQWETFKIPATENYSNELNTTNLRGYLRDEIYAFEICFLLDNGKQTDGFHIPGRALRSTDLGSGDIENTNSDFILSSESGKYWQIYNTATVLGDSVSQEIFSDPNYKGPYQYGDMSYWESEETYPCNKDVWGELAGTPIRHHKFPDVTVSPIFESGVPTKIVTDDNPGEIYELESMEMANRAIYPIGIRINVQEIQIAITQSELTQEQKNSIIGFKIIRGNRDVNKSITGKGILRNVGKYEREGTEYYFPNYPYNDLREDPFVLNQSNAYLDQCRVYQAQAATDGEYEFTNCFTNTREGSQMVAGEIITVCSITLPEAINGDFAPGTLRENYDTYQLTLKPPTREELLLFTSSSGILKFEFKVTFAYEDYRFPGEELEITLTSSRQLKIDAGILIGIPGTSTKSGNEIVNVVSGTKPRVIRYRTAPINLVGQLNPISNELEKRMKWAITLQGAYSINLSCYPTRLNGFEEEESKFRHTFNSPETSFGQPFLGDILKIENVLYGKGSAHFVKVKNNATYKLITIEAQKDALESSKSIGEIGDGFNATAMFTAYQAYLQIYINGITRQNYGWSYNSILDYNYSSPVENNGFKQRKIQQSQYLYPGVQSVNEPITLNNFSREGSVYLRTSDNVSAFPFPADVDSLKNGEGDPLIIDRSRYKVSQVDCDYPEQAFDISSVAYYASLKTNIPNQWGQIYSYETIDTGFQFFFKNLESSNIQQTVFGGDTFINKFAFKTKIPFFIDNRVGAPDDSDIYYDEIGNIGYPEHWHSARSVLYDYNSTATGLLRNIISVKAHQFDCPNNQLPKQDTDATPAIINPDRTYYGGNMYLSAYGIPSYYCESSINVDLRQAFNKKEGDFFPHVSSGIPDDWLQETNVPISQDNTYYYNISYSKQNKENFFTHLPVNWEEDLCFTNFPYRAIYSEPQQSYSDNRINSWVIYRPISFFDFPQNYGKLTSLDGIQNRGILARFENKSLLYNTLLTIDTSNPQAAYVGNDKLFRSSPPIDFAETDLGYVGSQHKFLLKIPQGQITVDAKRGQIFLISGKGIIDISAFGSGMSKFLIRHLPFEIITKFRNVNIDNHFKNIGLHGVYDSNLNRVIISKLDYFPLSPNIKYDEDIQEFYIEKDLNGVTITEIIDVTNTEFFCNKSWTLSYSLNTNSWISFHSYIPNFYISENNFFYSGLNQGCDLEAIAAEIVPTTTTTSTTTQFIDCSLAGEVEILYCTLQGTALLLTDCELQGVGYFEEPIPATTTTSTTSLTSTTTSSSTTTSTTTLP